MRPTVAVLALVLVPLVPALPSFSAPCPGFVVLDGQGPSCPVPGGYEVVLADGSRVFTHGPDHSVVNGNPLSLTNPPPSADPACVNGLSTPSIHIAYAYPSDKPSRIATVKPLIADIVKQANGLLRAESALYGETADLRITCISGVMDIPAIRLPTRSTSDSFASIVGELRQVGYNGNMQRHWIFYDDTVSCGGCIGQANMFQDDRLAFDNKHILTGGGSQTTTFGISYGVFDTGLALHEILHTLGAVQKTAPHSTVKNHCTDGLDVMCWADGGGAYSGTVCSDRTHIDCNGDDYFQPAAPRGTYLAEKWNLGSHLVPFFRWGTETAPPAVTFVVPQTGFVHTGCAPGLPYAPGRTALKTTGCIQLSLADASGIAKVEIWRGTTLLHRDTTGSTTATYTFPITQTTTNSVFKIDVYDMRGNFGTISKQIDLIV